MATPRRASSPRTNADDDHHDRDGDCSGAEAYHADDVDPADDADDADDYPDDGYSVIPINRVRLWCFNRQASGFGNCQPFDGVDGTIIMRVGTMARMPIISERHRPMFRPGR